MGCSFFSCYDKPNLTKSLVIVPKGLKKTILTSLDENKEDTFECGPQNETNENVYDFDNFENININFPNGQN